MIKKIILLLFISQGLWSQSGIANLDFENWTGNTPSGFPICTGVTQQVASPYSGSKYVRITSNGVGFPGMSGFMILNGNGNSTLPGWPCTLTPSVITGYIRTSMLGQDTMYITGNFRKNGVPVGAFSYSTAQTYTAWQAITIPVNFFNAVTPDTMQLSFIANKAIMNKPPCTSGSYLEVDNFFLGVNNPATAVTELAADVPASVYPNPANHHLLFNIKQKGPATVSIYAANGSFLESVEVNDEAAKVNVEAYAAGLYTYRLQQGNSTWYGKFLVSH